MALYARRKIQQIINELAEVVPRKGLKKLVNDGLNKMHSPPSIASEWELILIYALSKLGQVENEKIFKGSRRPDIYFKLNSNSTDAFVADITAISDKGFDDSNPHDVLEQELINRVKDRGFRLNAFSFDFGSNYREAKKGGFRTIQENNEKVHIYTGAIKVKLKLPGIARFKEKVFNKKFEEFLDSIEKAIGEDREYIISEPDGGIDLTIMYRPKNLYSSTRGLDHKKINHLTQNTLYQALESKATQLIESGASESLSIFLCDGGYTPFHSRADHHSHSVKEVIEYFLKIYSQIHFVLTFVPERNTYPPKLPKHIITTLYKGAKFSDLSAGIVEAIIKIQKFLPEPDSDSENALNLLKGGAKWGYPMEGRRNRLNVEYVRQEIKISSRLLIEFLSGRLTQEEFYKHCGFLDAEGKHTGFENPFHFYLLKGSMINEIRLEKQDSSDDDAIILRFGDPDPAISKFIVPAVEKKQH